MSWLLYNGNNNNNERKRKMKKLSPDDSSSGGKIVLDLRNGTASALTRLSYRPQEIDHVILRRPAFPTRASDDDDDNKDLHSVLQAMTQLDLLKTIAISDFGPVPLPVSCLVILLRQSLSLSTLRLDSVCLSGRRQEFDLLAHFLQRHPSLKKICFSGFRFDLNDDDDDDVEKSPLLLPIAMALSQIPTLKTVEILEASCPCCWTGEWLSELCKSQSLSTLRIRGIRFLNDGDVALIAQTIQSNMHTSLKELWILSCDLGGGYHGDSVGSVAIAQMLRTNNTLEVLGLNQLSMEEHAMAIADALKSNRSLTGLHLCLRNGFTSSIYASLAKLMEHNYALEKSAED